MKSGAGVGRVGDPAQLSNSGAWCMVPETSTCSQEHALTRSTPLVASPGVAPPLVAVVTPVLNGQDFLAEALQSVQDQTYPNIIHIVQDNCSGDATPDIIRSFQNRRVKVIHLRSDQLLPQAENWERAFRGAPAEAEYVRLLCHDDTLRADCIARTVELCEREPDVMVAASGLIVGTTSDYGMAPTTLGDWPSQDAIFPGRDLVRKVLLDQAWVIGNQVTLRRALMDRHAPFIKGDWHHIDTELVMRCALEGRVAYTPEPLSFMRQHAATVTSRMGRLEPFFFDGLKMILTWGPDVLNPQELKDTIRGWKAIYVRRLVKWRLNNRPAWTYHMERLKSIGQAPSHADYVAALADWPLARLRPQKQLYLDNAPGAASTS
jgi:glycosyltransferase involved in cell wall biosynthesis